VTSSAAAPYNAGNAANRTVFGKEMSGDLNLLKLCVGADSVEDLADWQARRLAETGAATAVHVTRMWPRREAELLDGGSLYWVIRGATLARQAILGLEARDGADGVRRCAILLDPRIVRTSAQPRRPFQGWRYLSGADAPADLGEAGTRGDLPPELAVALDLVGVR